MIVALGLFAALSANAEGPSDQTLPDAPGHVVIDITKRVNTFVPIQAMGAAIDGMEKGEVDRYITPFNIDKMKSSGLRRVTYRLRPELGIEVWHWTEEGRWSDPVHRQGYWTSSDNPSRHPRVTWGYSLPRRGDSVDQAADTGYSRLDDGDTATFWKSNPYLDRRYTGAAETRPQWIVVSFDNETPIDAARIAWAAPFARHFVIQYWTGNDQSDQRGRWLDFPFGDRRLAGEPDDGVIKLADTPIKTRSLRIMLLEPSGIAPAGSTDIRDSLGYAVREVGFGTIQTTGEFSDAVRHGPSRDDQTLVQVSSTDPWHRAVDRDPGEEQPSLDLIFEAGLNGGLPLIVPVGVFYDTPENAAAEVRYLKRRRYPVNQIELGEEPDGQFIAPEDYADLFIESATAIHAIDPELSLGGPSMQEAITDTWPDPENGRSWIGRFVARLKSRGRLADFAFFSFEHYPFDEVCRPADDLLRSETTLMNELMAATARAGVPRTIPWIISEYGFSPFSGRAMSEVPSALLAADIVGHFLTLGGQAAFMFGYTPDVPANQNFPCAGFGNMMLFEADDRGRSRWPMPVYYAERMMLEDWGSPDDKPHALYGADSDLLDEHGRPILVAYPLLAPDGHWAVMLINRDSHHAHEIGIVFRGNGQGEVRFGGRAGLEVVQYGASEYKWLDLDQHSHPVKDLPPRRFHIPPGEDLRLTESSLTIVSGSGPQP